MAIMLGADPEIFLTDSQTGQFVSAQRQRFFDGQPCVGKMIETDGQRFRVVGVVEDVTLLRRSASAESSSSRRSARG